MNIKKGQKDKTSMEYLKTMLHESLRTGITELLILDILTEGDSYGYDVFKKLTDRTNNVFKVFHTAIYTYLRRLLAKGLIEVRAEQEAVANVSRRMVIYGITENGRIYLDEGRKLYKTITGQATAVLFAKKK